MPLERRGSRAYYYRGERHGSKVVRRYVGCGEVAEMAAAVDELSRLERAAADRLREQERQRLLAAEGPLLELCGLAEALAHAALLAAGYHRHDRGAWRRRHDDGEEG